MNNQQRLIEFAAGLYSHPDVSKFIYQALNAGPAEVCSNLLTPISSPFPTFPSGGCFSPPTNSPFGGVQVHDPSFGSGNPFAVSGGKVMTSFGGQNPTLFTEDMELKVNVEPQQIYIFSKTHQEYYTSAYKMFLDNKILGVGVKNFRVVCNNERYYVDGKMVCNTHPHNTYIQILAELGIVGFLFLLATLFYFCMYNKELSP